ncbi:hypothetical protein PHYSODRAFT_288815 [Phytophthora sojae]|uniref:RxLR effector protein n=2 Tax=Phytophthora sojae TaxID=67593 RepID=G5A8F4_PHYSP|nr:hypothetical protein PHYSODRAFT_288815 [Phytophthora sojae]AEK80883.1 Avh195 [Phytophthora sojae]AEK80884.1 Avh195 [Phytophthora sojae]AEK80885.1 Avh195 [Phytophthora sojae]EGZ08180.1 hypothetical protein PHYSODRAFT_288815 [Phytophthora sojae]|eukprot:XP_009536352.1 hypothetical protein PHYSODRAFT_288815 [Phytophthora sojae]
MRAFIILLMAVTALLASVSGSVSNLQTSQSLVQPINAAEPEMTQGRLLLRTAPVDDEERGAVEVIKELGKSTKKATKDTLHKIYVKSYQGLENSALIDQVAELSLRKSFNPNQVYKWLNLDKIVR